MLKPYLLQLDLQLFSADGGEFGGYDPSSAYDGIPASEPQVQPQGQGEGFQPQGEPQGEPQGQPQGQPQQPQVLDFGGRQIPAVDDSILGLHKDFTEQQRYITSLQEQVNAYKMVAQQVQPQAQPPGQPQAPEVSSNVAEWTEETWQEFYDKPQDIIGKLVQSEIQKFAADKLDPILQERQWSGEIQSMYDQFQDFDTYVGDIQALVDQFPDQYAQPGGLENAYYRAKALSVGSTNPAQLAQDPQFLNQYVVNNPQVQNQVVGNYLQGKQQVNAQLPNNMGRGTGGMTPQSPEASPTTLREASRQFLKNLGVR